MLKIKNLSKENDIGPHTAEFVQVSKENLWLREHDVALNLDLLQRFHEHVLEGHEVVTQEGALGLKQVPHRLLPLGLQARLDVLLLGEGEGGGGRGVERQGGNSHGWAPGAPGDHANTKLQGRSSELAGQFKLNFLSHFIMES